jgi:hemolysin III
MAIFGICVFIACLIYNHNDWRHITSAIIYGLSISLLFIFSCLYHALTNPTAKWKVFKRFDHISIYLLIGGTYAPCLLLIPNLQTPLGLITPGILMFIIQWILIIIGITCKSIWLNKYHWIHLIIYLVLGWTALFFIKDIYAFNTTFFWLIVCGGISYTIGVVFYIFYQVKYFHFVWHIFVNVGAVLHSIAIVLYLFI